MRVRILLGIVVTGALVFLAATALLLNHRTTDLAELSIGDCFDGWHETDDLWPTDCDHPHTAKLYAIIDVDGGGTRADQWMCSEHLGSIRIGIPSDIDWKPLRSDRNDLLYCALISPSRQLNLLEHPDYWDPDFEAPSL